MEKKTSSYIRYEIMTEYSIHVYYMYRHDGLSLFPDNCRVIINQSLENTVSSLSVFLALCKKHFPLKKIGILESSSSAKLLKT